MNETLEKLKLVRQISFELEVAPSAFAALLRQQVDPSNLGVFSNPFEAFSSSANHYLGVVEPTYFRIRKRHRLFDQSMLPAIAEGQVTAAGPRTLVTAEINGFVRWLFLPSAVMLLFFLIGTMVSVFVHGAPWALLVFTAVQASIMLGIPYYMMRRSTAKLAYELERDFFYLASKHSKAA